VRVTTVGSGIQLFNTYLFWGPGMSTGAFLNEAVVKLLCLGSSWLISSCFTDMMECFFNNVFRVLKHVNWKVPSNLAINVTSGDGTPTQAITGYRNASICTCLYHPFMLNCYHLVMTNSLPWKDPPFLIGKPVNHLFLWAIYTMAMLVITLPGKSWGMVDPKLLYARYLPSGKIPWGQWGPWGYGTLWVHVRSHWGINFSDLVEPSNIHQRARISGIGFRVNRSILKYPRFWDSSPKYRRAVTRSFFCEDPSNERKQRQGISAKVGRCKKLPLRGCDSCDSWAKMVVTCCDMPSPSISRPRLVRYHPCNAQTWIFSLCASWAARIR